jgi:hypothetical protein
MTTRRTALPWAILGLLLWPALSFPVEEPPDFATAPPGFDKAASALNATWLGSVANGQCRAVALQGDYAYFGSGGCLIVADVGNLTAPVEVGKVTFPGPIFAIAVSGDYAYVADGYDGLRIVDISNPAAPAEIGFLDTPGLVGGVTVVGSRAYVEPVPKSQFLARRPSGRRHGAEPSTAFLRSPLKRSAIAK